MTNSLKNSDKLPNLSLYFITDNGFGWSHTELAKKVIDAGIEIIQFREKDLPLRKRVEIGKELRKLTSSRNVTLIVNDRIDVAQAIDADGVHLGQDDLPLEDGRKILGKDKIIGASVETVDEAKRAVKKGADYLGVGTVFPTSTKNNIGDIIGLDRLREICEVADIPCVGIGGIDFNNASKIIESGANGVAVISAIADSENPREKAERLLKKVERY